MDIFKELQLSAKKDNIEKIVVGAIITNKNGEVFIARRKLNDFMGGYFEIPGGNLEKGETIYDTLVRETKEETNLDITKIVSYVNCFDYVSDSGEKSRQFNFAVEVESTDNIILTEHDYYEWLDINDLEKLDKMSDEVKYTLEKYFFNVT